MMKITALLGGAGLVLVCAGVPTPAQAAPATYPGVVYAQSSVQAYESGCVSSTPQSSEPKTVPITGVPTTSSVDTTGTVAKPGGPATKVDLRSTATTALVTRAGTFSTFDLNARGRSAVTLPAGATCSARGLAQHEITVEVAFSRPQWLTARATAGARTATWINLERLGDSDQNYSMDSEESGGTAVASWYLPAGSFYLSAAVNWDHYSSFEGSSGEHTGTGSIHLEASDAGSAIAAPSGSGRAYLALGAAQNCATATLPTTFTARGGRVKSATFLVNGARKKVVRNPAAGRKVTLTGMPRYRRNDVRVRLVVDPPGAARTATVVVSRSYRACLPVF